LALCRKAAGHELKSLNSLISCNVRSLHFPLMALANYLGYRVIVISKVCLFVVPYPLGLTLGQA
jgi:hypothetical protein